MARDLRLTLSKEDLRRLYVEEKKSLEDIGRMYGVSRVAVWKYCKAEGLKRRTKSEARLEAQKKGKVAQEYFEINESFFSKWSPEMAYIFGLLITDGCISKVKSGSYKISICLNDRDLLEKVAGTMGSSHAVSASKYQRGLYLFLFAREKLAQDLLRLGLKPRKSLDIKFPDVPEEYLTDFIRGVFDGDGSVFFEKGTPMHPLRASFVSSSKDFVEGVEEKLQTLGMPKRNIYKHCTKNAASYTIRYAHRDCVKLFRFLYKNALENGLYLRRKYYRFVSGMRSGK